jgi:hypothetical protein
MPNHEIFGWLILCGILALGAYMAIKAWGRD